ncbi:MAG: hypothetical protein BWY28_01909 [bacterium ADurb.Bin236]|nr:MAG: hypothetical protein BWY28_01909 [bacterium ADurb.Bin236]
MNLDVEIETVSGEAIRTPGVEIYLPIESVVLIRIDVERAMRNLTPRQQDICRFIAAGRTQTEASQFLKCSRTVISKEIATIRRVFRRFHLDDYVTNTGGRSENNGR